jgi:hypothetical protein
MTFPLNGDMAVSGAASMSSTLGCRQVLLP